MTSALLVLVSAAGLGASLALLAADLGWPRLADALAISAALGGLAAVILVGGITLSRARQLGR